MKKINIPAVCFLAFAAVLNIVGGSIALMFRLPIYLDSLGTMMAAAFLGPIYGMIPGIVSGVLGGCISDPYAFYYIPVQMVIGVLSGILFRHTAFLIQANRGKIFLFSALLSIPGTIVSSIITAFVFGGITSSGSTILVQLLAVTGLNLPIRVFLVQAVTDYADRAVVLFAAMLLYKTIPSSLRVRIAGNETTARKRI